MRRLFALVLLLISAAPAFAVNPDEVLKDPALETRARALSAQLRCMVCQNQSIDDSNADLAKDLRLLVRERLTAGDSDDEVIEYLVSRYGEFVLLKPRLSEHTILLWGMPAALAAIGVGVVLVQLRRKRISEGTQDLSADEQSKLDALLKRED
ncbi:cytochrome c-type biogenesis protein CcmH [Rhizobium sp. TRM95796]|uniref:cytochrome c-type biogenesis protein n=1 Tax=Rhizobium sp. TRM95796 TaxID=2979862 RepID=UPI0021E84120|nr:cytochrome c-type biogenesis protein [Rhizobium sp. TRM95796]MCV3765592.1 cytochrome c-type biogenesis protein CcmH [Rhizobium sp. TRM95796]